MSQSAPWLQTLGSGALDLINPSPGQIDFGTIATVLSRAPRFGGHTERGVYSVAQHCEQGARAIMRDTGRCDWAAAFLLHDAHEAYIGDMPTPVRDALASIGKESNVYAETVIHTVIRELKNRLDAAIYTRAGLPWPLDGDTQLIVKAYDLRMGRTERDARLAPPPRVWNDSFTGAEPVKGCDLSPMSETWARCKFSDALRDLLAIRC